MNKTGKDKTDTYIDQILSHNKDVRFISRFFLSLIVRLLIIQVDFYVCQFLIEAFSFHQS